MVEPNRVLIVDDDDLRKILGLIPGILSPTTIDKLMPIKNTGDTYATKVGVEEMQRVIGANLRKFNLAV